METNPLGREIKVKMAKVFETQAMLNMNLRERLAIMADLAQRAIRIGLTSFMGVAILTPDEVFYFNLNTSEFPSNKEVKATIIGLTEQYPTQGVVLVGESWGVKQTGCDPCLDVPPSQNPLREEYLVIEAKDASGHLMGTQQMRRTDKEIDFEPLQISNSPSGWLDEWRPQA